MLIMPHANCSTAFGVWGAGTFPVLSFTSVAPPICNYGFTPTLAVYGTTVFQLLINGRAQDAEQALDGSGSYTALSANTDILTIARLVKTDEGHNPPGHNPPQM